MAVAVERQPARGDEVAGTYLTDDVHLYRLLGVGKSGAYFENCGGTLGDGILVRRAPKNWHEGLFVVCPG